MPYLERIGILSEAPSTAVEFNHFFDWLKECYGQQLVGLNMEISSKEVVDNSDDAVMKLSMEQFKAELQDLPEDLFSLLMMDRHLAEKISCEEENILIDNLKRFDWVYPPAVMFEEKKIPHFIVVEKLTDDSMRELDWGVELARFATGRLTVLHSAGVQENLTFEEAEEQGYRRKIFDKLAVTDYRTLERGVQLRVFACDLVTAIKQVASEYPPWMIIVNQECGDGQLVKQLETEGGILFLGCR